MRPELIGDDQNAHTFTPSERGAKTLVQGLHIYTSIRSSAKRIFLPPSWEWCPGTWRQGVFEALDFRSELTKLV